MSLATLVQVLPLSWFGVTAWLFIQDNAAGELTGWRGIGWVGLKSFFVGVAAGVVAAVHACATWISGREGRHG